MRKSGKRAAEVMMTLYPKGQHFWPLFKTRTYIWSDTELMTLITVDFDHSEQHGISVNRHTGQL